MRLLLGLALRLLSLLLGRVAANAQLVRHPVPSAEHVLPDLSKEGLGGRRRAVLEVGVLPARQGTQLIEVRPLRRRDAVAVQVGLELALAPRLKDVGLGRVGGAREEGGSRGVRVAASGRSRGIR